MRAVAVLLIATTSASAAPVEVALENAGGTPGGEPARTIAGAIANASTVYYDECERDCRSQAIAQLALAGDDVLQLRRVREEPNGTQVFRVLALHGEAWTAWSESVRIERFGCATGRCIEQTVERIEVAETDGIAWMRMRVRWDKQFTDREFSSNNVTNHYDIVIGCKLAPELSCAQIQGDGRYGSTSTIRGRRVITRKVEDDKPMAIVTTFDL